MTQVETLRSQPSTHSQRTIPILRIAYIHHRNVHHHRFLFLITTTYHVLWQFYSLCQGQFPTERDLVLPLSVTSIIFFLNHLTSNGHFSGRTAPLTSRFCILYIYSTNIRTEYFKHAAHSPIFPLQNVVYFIMLPFLVPVLFTFIYRVC